MPCAQYDDLVKIPVVENGERFVALQSAVPEILCEYEKPHMKPITGDVMYVREEVAKKIKKAAIQLSRRMPGAKLRVVFAYRHPKIQKKYFNAQRKRIKKMFPGLKEKELQAKAHLLSASPDVAGHPTGGCIDLTITTMSGDLDMGTRIADFSNLERIRFSDIGVTARQKRNRTLLRTLMVNQGFAPFDGEWWHFSYGDREWAHFYKKSRAIFGPIEFTTDV